jgi:hypothetical protein
VVVTYGSVIVRWDSSSPAGHCITTCNRKAEYPTDDAEFTHISEPPAAALDRGQEVHRLSAARLLPYLAIPRIEAILEQWRVGRTTRRAS